MTSGAQFGVNSHIFRRILAIKCGALPKRDTILEGYNEVIRQ